MRTFRPTFTENGQRRESKRWHVGFRDHNGARRSVVGFTDKRATDELGRRIGLLVAARVSGQAIEPDMAAWLERLPDDLRTRLAAFGLIDDRASSIAEPLEKHVERYHAALIAKGNTAAHADSRRVRVLRVVEGCRFTFWRDIKAGAVEKWLADQRAEGMSTQTSNHYVVAVRGFCKWMTDDGRAACSPDQTLRGVAVTDAKDRGTFTVEQVQRLVAATTASASIVEGMDGPTRALLYRLAVETALRAGALRSLTAASVRFDDDGGAIVTVEAGQQKNRRKHRVPIRPDLAAELARHVARCGGGALFTVPRAIARVLRADLEAAGLPLFDVDGHALLFHSFRHTTATWLAGAGVPWKSIQAITGHRTLGVLMDRYAHIQDGAAREALAELPDFDREPLRATGTDDVPCAPLARPCPDTGPHGARMAVSDATKAHGAAARPVRAALKTSSGLAPLVGSNPTPTAFPERNVGSAIADAERSLHARPQ